MTIIENLNNYGKCSAISSSIRSYWDWKSISMNGAGDEDLGPSGDPCPDGKQESVFWENDDVFK